eukprot:SAG11_NODE_7824_length_1092_cov_1.061430_2_plen_151_part_01
MLKQGGVKVQNPLMMAGDGDDENESEEDATPSPEPEDDGIDSAARDIYHDHAGKHDDHTMSRLALKGLLQNWHETRCMRSVDEKARWRNGEVAKNAKVKDLDMYLAQILGRKENADLAAFNEWWLSLPDEWRRRVMRKRELDSRWKKFDDS